MNTPHVPESTSRRFFLDPSDSGATLADNDLLLTRPPLYSGGVRGGRESVNYSNCSSITIQCYWSCMYIFYAYHLLTIH